MYITSNMTSIKGGLALKHCRKKAQKCLAKYPDKDMPRPFLFPVQQIERRVETIYTFSPSLLYYIRPLPLAPKTSVK